MYRHPPERDREQQGCNRLDHAAGKGGGRHIPSRTSFNLAFGRRGLFKFLENVELLADAKSSEIVGVVPEFVVSLFATAVPARIHFRSRRRHWCTRLVQREPVQAVAYHQT